VSQSAPPSGLALGAWWGQVSAPLSPIAPTGLQPPPLQYNMASTPLKTANLQARYRSPNAEKIFCHDSGVSGGEPTKQSSTAKRVAYLGTLRLSVAKLQEDINTFLTQKMDEDKAAAVAGFVDTGKGKIRLDDEQEEENYGEEDVNEDD
jgi:Gon7 family